MDAIHYHTMLLYDHALDRGLAPEEAERHAAFHGEHHYYEFGFGRFVFLGLRQKFWQPFEAEHRLRQGRFRRGRRSTKVLYPWDDSITGGTRLRPPPPELGLGLPGRRPGLIGRPGPRAPWHRNLAKSEISNRRRSRSPRPCRPTATRTRIRTGRRNNRSRRGNTTCSNRPRPGRRRLGLGSDVPGTPPRDPRGTADAGDQRDSSGPLAWW